MTQYQLLGKTYEIPKTSADFLDSYIKRLKNYISHNDISESYLDDILERINDKLTQLADESFEIKNADIIKIVNDIGEAEDIFPREQKESHKKTPTQNILQKKLQRDTENAMLFGVCSGIARHLGVEALWIRILFIVFTFTGGAGIIIYIFLIFLIPSDKKTKVEQNSTIPSSSIINQLSAMVGSSFRGIFRLILIFIFSIIGLILTGFFIAGVMLSGIVLSGSFEIGNQQFLGNIPDVLRVAIPLLTVIVGIMVTAVFRSIIGKDLFDRRGWLMVSIFAAIGCILLSTGGIQMAKEYTWTEQKSTQSELVFTGKTLIIKDELQNYTNGNNLRAGSIDSVEIERVDTLTGKIRIQMTETFFTKNQDTATKIINSKISPTLTLTGNTLTLTKLEIGDFRNMVPFSFFHREIKIMVPMSIEVEGMNRYSHRFNKKERPEVPEIPEVPEEI